VLLVTPAKDCVVDPVTFLDAELSDLLQRLEQSEASKWQALQELGLDTAASVATPARRNGGRAQ
jgi:hypothetical protein